MKEMNLKHLKKLDEATEKTLDSNRFLKKGVSTSGRYDIWKYSLSQYDKKNLWLWCSS